MNNKSMPYAIARNMNGQIETIYNFKSQLGASVAKELEKSKTFLANNGIVYSLTTEADVHDIMRFDKVMLNIKQSKDVSKDGGNYSSTGSSSHYKSNLIEYIDDIEAQQGTVSAYLTCINNAHKYTVRAGKKEGVTAEKDLIKRDWYLACGSYLKDKINGKIFENRPFIPTPMQVALLFTHKNEVNIKVTNTNFDTLETIVNNILHVKHT